ncbi:hypothetical protein [Streptomyces parvulus]|uniref:hypothetical protein n=1 Tax=Streptomyces parvulus TaxID=146923 RepID=UPI003447D31B
MSTGKRTNSGDHARAGAQDRARWHPRQSTGVSAQLETRLSARHRENSTDLATCWGCGWQTALWAGEQL